MTFLRTTADGPNGFQFTTDPESSGNRDGRLSGFNESGQMAFVAQFTDDSEGVFLATFPAPGNGDADNDGIPDELDVEPLQDAFNNVPLNLFRFPGNQGQAIGLLETVEQRVAGGNTRGAIFGLLNLRNRVDGCSRGASPDLTDWVLDCTSQNDIRDAIDTLIVNLAESATGAGAARLRRWLGLP